MELIAAALLLIFLLASTLGWAVIYSRRSVDENILDSDLARTRLWASAVPLGVILVLIAASFMALFTGHLTGGIDRLRYGLGMWPTAQVVEDDDDRPHPGAAAQIGSSDGLIRIRRKRRRREVDVLLLGL